MEKTNVKVKLKNGESFTGIYDADHSITVKSFTAETIHRIVLDSGNRLFVQGDQIAYFLAD